MCTDATKFERLRGEITRHAASHGVRETGTNASKIRSAHATRAEPWRDPIEDHEQLMGAMCQARLSAGTAIVWQHPNT